jgi:N-formylmaleamate deformylase
MTLRQGNEEMKKSESVFFCSGDLRLHAARHPGSGDRPMVVVPGITTPAGAFAVAASRFTDVGSDVYVLDMRGRGLSQRVPYGAHRAGDYADDVLALIDHLGLHQPLLVGHSLGARVVANARARFPGASAGVVAIDPPMSGPGRRPYPMALDRFLSGLHGARAGHGAEQARADYPTWTDEEIRLRGEWLASCDEAAVVESYAWFHLEAFEPVWREVEPPALLLYGADSPVVTAEDAALLRRVNPRAEVVAVADSGHMIPWDNLGQTVADIEGFLSRLKANA